MTLCLKEGLFLLIFFFFLVLHGFSVHPTADTKEKITRAWRGDEAAAGKSWLTSCMGTSPNQLIPKKSGWREGECPMGSFPSHLPTSSIPSTRISQGRGGSRVPAWPLWTPALAVLLGSVQSSCEKRINSLGELTCLGWGLTCKDPLIGWQIPPK